MKILIADDEMKIRTIIRKYAEFEGYDVDEASDGMLAVDLCRIHHYDLVIMDVMMPELDGFSAVREIRNYSNVPVLMLSARGEVYDRIHGFEVGVDDYVVKPFSPKELMMRVSAILNRTAQKDKISECESFVLDGLSVNFSARTVKIDGEKVDLSPKGYELLCYLIRHRNIALTRNQIIDEIWGNDYYGDERTLDTHVKLLRKALGPYAGRVVTLRGVGYRFDT